MFGALPIFDVRANFGVHELANRVADKGLVVGEGEVHVQSSEFNCSRVQRFRSSGTWFLFRFLHEPKIRRKDNRYGALLDGWGVRPGNGRKRKKEKTTLRRGGARRNHESHLHW